MPFKTLITRNGYAPYSAEEYTFEVVDGGALKITDSGGTVDLIGPGFWVAVVDSSAEDRLTWEFLAQPGAPEVPLEAVRVTIEGGN